MARSFQNVSLALRGLAFAALLAPLAACVVQNTPSGTPDATPIGEPPATANTPPAPPAPEPGPTAPQPTPTQQPPAGDASLAGTWSSASCGDRKYERILTIGADGTFSSKDMVSPCPPDAKCIWSGIVDRKGRYTRSGDSLTLTVEGPAGDKGKPLPPTLTIDKATGAPAEQAGGATCVYTKK